MWSTPALDLTYIFVMLADDRLAEQRRDEIIRVYYDQLVDTLKKINYLGSIPSMLELQIAILESAPLDLVNAFVGIPPRLFNFREMDLSEFMDNVQEVMKNVANTIHDKPEYQEYLMTRLKRLDQTGVLDG